MLNGNKCWSVYPDHIRKGMNLKNNEEEAKLYQGYTSFFGYLQ